MTHDTIVRDLLEAGEFRSNKLTAAEYDETTWSARTWLSFVFQRLSVACIRRWRGAEEVSLKIWDTM